MNSTDEQKARHAATMAFFQSAADTWEETKALLIADDEERQRLECDYQSRCVKPVVKDDEGE